MLDFLSLAEIWDWQWENNSSSLDHSKTCSELRSENREFQDFLFISQRFSIQWSENQEDMFSTSSASSWQLQDCEYHLICFSE